MQKEVRTICYGEDLYLEAYRFEGIVQPFPKPMLRGSTEVLKSIRIKLFEPQFAELTVVDFSDLAQGCKTYAEFISKMANASESKLKYIGIAVCGNKKQVNKLIGNLSLLR